jgi:DNA-directed RNA polymerase sigma subunit (sigma70/sigma32)
MATVRRRLTREQAERRARVVELRCSPMTFDEIGHQVGLSSQRAGRILHDALAALPRYGVDELRAEETELIDRAVNSLRGVATDCTPPSWQ